MAYCTKQDLWDRFGEEEITQASDHDSDGIENTEAIDAAIKDAADIINQYLNSRYILPLTCIPDTLLGLSCNIARYLLHDNRATETIIARYQEALKMLGLLRSREIDLYDAVCGDVFTERTANQVTVIARERVYTPALMGKIFS